MQKKLPAKGHLHGVSREGGARGISRPAREKKGGFADPFLSDAQAKEKFVLMGIITDAHGIKGEVKVKAFTENPVDICAYGALTSADGRAFLLSDARMGAKGAVIVRVEGVTDRNAAEALKHTPLFAPREALPEGMDDEPFYADLVGLTVQDAVGAIVGTLVNVFDNGAHDVLEIKPEKGNLILVPFADDFIAAVDITAGTLTLTADADGLLNL